MIAPQLMGRSVRLRLLGLLAAAVAGPTCANVPDGESAGGPLVSATVELALGQLDGSDEYVLGRVSGVAGRDQRIYIADHQTDVIRANDWNGVFLFTVATRGAGPGEVRGPCCLALGPRGRLWVRDTGNGRYNAYRITAAGAEFEQAIRMVHGGAGLWVAPTFDPAGHLIDVGPTRSGGTGPIQTRHHLDSAGQLVNREIVPTPPEDSLAQHTVTRRSATGTVAQLYFYQPYGPMHLVAHSPLGGLASGVSSRYAVRWIGPDSAFDRVLALPIVGPDVSPIQRDSALERLGERVRFAGLTVNDLPFGIPDRKPPIRHLQFDAAGRLWIHLTPQRTEPQRAHVYNRRGDIVQTVEWPADVNIRYGYIGDGFLLGVRTDSLGVPQVIRLGY